MITIPKHLTPLLYYNKSYNQNSYKKVSQNKKTPSFQKMPLGRFTLIFHTNILTQEKSKLVYTFTPYIN